MAQSTRIVSFLALLCIVYTSILPSPTQAGPMPSGAHSQEPLEDGRLSRAHFDDFVRALTRSSPDSIVLSPSSTDEEMPNEVFPLDSTGEHKADQQRALHEKSAPVQKRYIGRYCGSGLADILEMLCGKSFLGLFGKRSVPAAGQKSREESWPFVSGNKALQVLSNQHSFHRYTRGVHDECCLKACTFDELAGYCAVKPDFDTLLG